MKIVKPGYVVLNRPTREEALSIIELAARTCYKSEQLITEDSSVKMVQSLIKRRHYAMLEHVHATVKIICDRGVSHEIVRHRLASYAQESTRYCNYAKGEYKKEITVVNPIAHMTDMEYAIWLEAMERAENAYMALSAQGASPQIARSVLPNSLKTEIVVTMNLREWIHFFNLRSVGTTGAPHPQMREVADMILSNFAVWIPEIFKDIWEARCYGNH